MKDTNITHEELSFDAFDEINSPRAEDPQFDAVVDAAISRRGFLSGVLTFGAGTFVMGTSSFVNTAKAATDRFGFKQVAASTADTISVPEGYKWDMLVKWGDPLGSVAKILMLIAFLVRFLHTHVSFRPTGECTMISFSGCHFPKEAILYAVFFYVRYGVSYRDLEEIMAERGVDVDHTTLNRWVIKYAPLIATEAQRRKSGTSTSWRMDETYIKVKGKWMYYYRAIDKFGKTLDFMLSEQRDEAAATAFFKRAIQNNGFPDRVVIDKSGANLAGLNNMNYLLLLNGWFWLIEILQVKYLNNIIEQDHRFIKKLTKQMKGFKSFLSASATLDGIEVAHMIRKKQFGTPGQSAFQQFSALAG